MSPPSACSSARPATTSSPNTRSPASANQNTYTQAPYPFACPGIVIATPGLPSTEEIEAELGRIGGAGTLSENEKS